LISKFYRGLTENFGNFRLTSIRLSNSLAVHPLPKKWKRLSQNGEFREEVVISQVGVDLYEKFFKNYTRKQWKRDPKDLDPSVCGRIPVRTNRDDRYLSEKFQALPSEGYTKLFQRMLNNPKIKIILNVRYQDVIGQIQYGKLIYTGPIDEYFHFRFGHLPYRSLRFERETLEQEFFQPAVQVNYPNDFDFTRIIEIKHVTGQKLPVTTIVREYPEDYGPNKEAYYPIPAPDAQRQYKQYAELAAKEKNVSFVGRLATYRYYNMDQVVGMALAEFERIKTFSLES
jgi:UDP-galactopyranose mutase